MDPVIFLIQCLNAVQYGLLLFLVASGLTLIFGIMGIINLAHGSFYMIGAYMAFALGPLVDQYVGGGFVTTILACIILSAILGYFLEWAFYSYLYHRDHLQQVLMTYGLILVFEELRSIIIDNDVHGVATPSWLSGSIALGDIMTYPTYRLFISAVCLVVAGLLYWLLTHTRLGMMIRAGAVLFLRWVLPWLPSPAQLPRPSPRCIPAWATQFLLSVLLWLLSAALGQLKGLLLRPCSLVLSTLSAKCCFRKPQAYWFTS